MDLEEDLSEMSEGANADAGPAEAFSVFCRSEYPVLVGVLSLLVGDRWVAEDLAQDALIRAWSKWDRVGSLDRPDLWTKHAALNLARSEWRRRQVADRAAGSARARPSAFSAARPHVHESLSEAVVRLPRRQRAAIAFRYFADMTIADTARAMGCSTGTVKALTSQGIATLRKTLAIDQEVDGD